MTDPVMLLSQVHGEGRITYRALTEAGFNTLAAIAAARAEVLSDKAFLSPATAGRLKAGAQEMLSATGTVSAAAIARVAPPREARIAGRRSAEAPFSEGIGSVEASLLGQGGATGALHHPHPEERHPQPHLPPYEPRVVRNDRTAQDDRAAQERAHEPIAKPLREDPHYAAFLPAAAARSASAAAQPGPAPPRGDGIQREASEHKTSFWSFGARRDGTS